MRRASSAAHARHLEPRQRRVRRLDAEAACARAVDLRETCRRLGYSYGYGRQLIAEGKFPVPAQPRLGKRGAWRFSTLVIERHLSLEASVADVA